MHSYIDYVKMKGGLAPQGKLYKNHYYTEKRTKVIWQVYSSFKIHHYQITWYKVSFKTRDIQQ